jgi:hypothetical protein
MSLELNPFKIVSIAFRADISGRAEERVALFAFYAHQFAVGAEHVEVFQQRQNLPILVSYERYSLFARWDS